MTPDQLRACWADGEVTFAGAVAVLTDEELTGPSLLPGWSRGRLLAHVASNADALVNLCTWARTGVETPMYASTQQREAAIARRAVLPPTQLRAKTTGAAKGLAEAVGAVPADAWATQVRTAQGRQVPAHELFWIRSREVWVHAVDLDAGVSFSALPEPVLVALVDEVFRMWAARDQSPELTVMSGRHRWGAGAGVVEALTLPEITAWVTGRARRPNWDLPRWL